MPLLIYGMGLTQQHSLQPALLRGNVGKPGANICAVCGHSNVQGQCTVGIMEKPSLAPLDKLSDLYHFTPPTWDGHSIVDACKAMVDGEVDAFISLGGNSLRAIPETKGMEAAWRKMRLSVRIAIKLNRSHAIHGQIAYLLPCLGRLEESVQASGPQAVSMESSVSHFHGSRRKVKSTSPHLLSEPAVIAGIAKAALPDASLAPWDDWGGDYATVRDSIESTYPETFKQFNQRLFQPVAGPRAQMGHDERQS